MKKYGTLLLAVLMLCLLSVSPSNANPTPFAFVMGSDSKDMIGNNGQMGTTYDILSVIGGPKLLLLEENQPLMAAIAQVTWSVGPSCYDVSTDCLNSDRDGILSPSLTLVEPTSTQTAFLSYHADISTADSVFITPLNGPMSFDLANGSLLTVTIQALEILNNPGYTWSRDLMATFQLEGGGVPVPEPSSALLLLSGIGILGYALRRK